jgi:hypothetical protein
MGMTQYFTHEFKRRHHSNPIALSEHSAFRAVVELDQVKAKPLDKCAESNMDFCVPILTGSLGPRQEVY